MEAFKKKMRGYDEEEVEKKIAELNDEIFNLRQQLFSAEKEVENNESSVNSSDNDFAAMNRTIDSHAAELQQKDAEIDRLTKLLTRYDESSKQFETALREKEQALQNAIKNTSADSSKSGRVINEQAAKEAITAYQSAIIAKDREIAALKTSVGDLNSSISVLKEQLLKLSKDINAASKKSAMPDVKVIEKIYLHAFEGAMDIASDAKDNVNELANRVFLELSSDIHKTEILFDDLNSAKEQLSAFIEQGAQQFLALERIIKSVSEININTSEQIKHLSISRDRIISDVETTLSAFRSEIKTELDQEGINDGSTNSSLPTIEQLIRDTDTKFEQNAANISEAAKNADLPIDLINFSFDSLYIDAPTDLEDSDEGTVQHIEIPPVPIFTIPAEIKSAEVFTPEPEPQAEKIQQPVHSPKAPEIPLAAPVQEPLQPYVEIAKDKLDEAEDEESYNPEDELNEMKEAIKRSIASKKEQDDILKQEQEKADEVKKQAENEAIRRAPDAAVKPKINVQDILKKYSNIN